MKGFFNFLMAFPRHGKFAGFDPATSSPGSFSLALGAGRAPKAREKRPGDEVVDPVHRYNRKYRSPFKSVQKSRRINFKKRAFSCF